MNSTVRITKTKIPTIITADKAPVLPSSKVDAKALGISATIPEKIINESFRIGKKSHEKCSYLSMPPLIINKKDIWSFKWSEAIPNFITHKKITATVVGYKNNSYRRQIFTPMVFVYQNKILGTSRRPIIRFPIVF